MNRFCEKEILNAFYRASSSDLCPTIQIVEKTGSTNTDLFQKGLEGAPEATVLFAESQSAGRGRLGRVWESPAGRNLYFSILLRPPLKTDRAFQLTLVAGLALYETLRSDLNDRLILKWPNDLWVEDRKLAGVLTEIKTRSEKIEFVVIGMGLNVNSCANDFSEELQTRITSLEAQTGQKKCRSTVAGEVLAHFLKRYEDYLKNGFGPIRKGWENAKSWVGQPVHFEDRDLLKEGIYEGLDENGFLKIKTRDGIERLIAGDVSLKI